MTRVFAAAGSAFLTFAFLMAASPALAAMGVLGDSLSDEYLGTPDLFGTQTDLPGLNWVQLLANLRGVDFGAFEGDPSVRGEPRNEGYEYNHARAGAAAASSPIFLPAASEINSQAAALAPNVTSGAVDIVSINIGHNDYFFRDYLDGFDQVAGDDPHLFVLDDADLLAFEQSVFDAIFASVDTIFAANAGARIALSYLPPGTLEDVPYIIDAMAQLNGRLDTELAARANPNLILVDLYDWGAARTDGSGNILIGPYALDPNSKADYADTVAGGTGPCDSAGNCATSAYALNMIAHDLPGGHPSTIMQGLIANEMLEAINPWLGAPLALLSDAEILGAAMVPEPGTALLLGSGLGALSLMRRRKFRSVS